MVKTYCVGNWVDQSKIHINEVKPTKLYFDCFFHNFSLIEDIVFIQVEPNVIHTSSNNNEILNKVKRLAPRFKKIISFNEEFEHLPNCVKYVYGTTWITPEEEAKVDINKKQFMISNLTNSKRFTTAHTFRHNLYNNQLRISKPCVFFIGTNTDHLIREIHHNPILGKSKFPLFETFQFSIAIENSRQKNYFTEKLCDCLVTKTIPIYFGCPNIHEYFDTTGWIILDSENVDDAIAMINSIDSNHYMKYIDTVEKNYATVQQYKDFYKTLNKSLE